MTVAGAHGAITVMRALIAGLAFASLLSSAAAHAEAGGPASGVYGEMLIGFNPASGAVTGYFDSATGGGQFQCIFYLTGSLHGAAASISTYFPETPADAIKGTLTVETRDSFKVRLTTEHGGCGNVEHFADDSQPAEFTLDTGYPWTSIAVVSSDKAYFYDTPASATHRKGYVVKGDGVGVRAQKPGWLQVDFVGGDTPVSGWIKQSDVFPTR